MKIHDIKTDNMLNGEGLRTVVFVSGCEHKCPFCHNKETWDENSGEEFTKEHLAYVMEELSKSYIDGITFSGGDPLHCNNREEILKLCNIIKSKFNNKTIWLYTGYTYEELIKLNDNTINQILSIIDVLVDGKFVKELEDVNYHWAGSTNQKVIRLK